MSERAKGAADLVSGGAAGLKKALDQAGRDLQREERERDRERERERGREREGEREGERERERDQSKQQYVRKPSTEPREAAPPEEGGPALCWQR